LGRLWLGSVADELVRKLPVPVLLIRPPHPKHANEESAALNHILIALDGSELSEMILEPVVPIARLTRARLTLVQVIVPPRFKTPDSLTQPVYNAASELERSESCAYLERLAARIARAGFTVDTLTLLNSSPARGILEAARQCDARLVAMATHGRTGWERIVTGSVEEDVIHATAVPLLVLGPASTVITAAHTALQVPA
jgi:nucleotide-binding universal stress UspA family protein